MHTADPQNHAKMTLGGRPLIAIIEPNTLATIGLKQVLEHVMPIVTIEAFSSFEDFEEAAA